MTRRVAPGGGFLTSLFSSKIFIKLKIVFPWLGLLALVACGGGVGGPAVGDNSAVGPVSGIHSSATGDLMGAKGDAEALPAGNLIAKTACLSLASPGTPSALSPGGDALKVSVPTDGTLKFLFKGTFETLGSRPATLGINCTASDAVNGAPIRIVWSSKDFTEPKYRDIPAEDLKDGVNLTLSGFTPKIGDHLLFYFYEDAFFVTEIVDEKSRKANIRNVFALPEFPAGITSPPSSDWAVISNDDVVYFAGLKRDEGFMFHPMGSLQFTAD
jgi:hypothetical protein